jgi:hypothetical protein
MAANPQVDCPLPFPRRKRNSGMTKISAIALEKKLATIFAVRTIFDYLFVFRALMKSHKAFSQTRAQ